MANYFNSTVERKTGFCLDCGNETYLTAERCTFCYSKYRKKKMLEKQKEKSKVRSLIQSPENLILLEDKGIVKHGTLELFYKVKMELNEPKCSECSAYKPTLKQWQKGWQSCQAHLLPKKHFRSIQGHPLNCLVLGSGFSGLCYCHDIYDSSWDKASKMKIWPEVVRRFLILYPLIAENERKFIPQILLDTLT